jgi:predicted HicB family RNase H-like nuclease
MKYKGYEAIIEYDEEDRLFVGRVINTEDIIVFDGISVDELERSFRTVIDEYLADCQALNKIPDTPFSGQLDLRISADLHKKIAQLALKEGVTLNALIEQILEQNI